MATIRQPQWPTDNTEPTRVLRVVAIGSIVFGILGGGFYWWFPLGVVVSMTGMLLGFADWGNARRRSLSSRLSIIGLLVSAATLALCIVIGVLGLQTITFGGR